MKRFFSFVFLGLGVAALAGCPIFPDNRDQRYCDGTSCYNCSDGYPSDSCYDWQCNSSADCPSGYQCDPNSDRCVVTGTTGPTGGVACSQPSDCGSGQTCGADNRCHTGDCASYGCPTQYVCELANGVASCVSVNGSGDGGTFSGCQSDSDCSSVAGAKCLDGACVSPANQCSDATQCPNNEQCVQGACTPSCSATNPCPTGYACDLSKGVCTGNSSPCTTSAQCGGNQSCVDQHCVDDCGPGNTCSNGLVCVDGGCIPDQKPQFVCNVEGTQDACQSGSICLHHNCYIGCDPEAGQDVCKASDTFNQCKSVSDGNATYYVCGSSTNLGSDCDPTQNQLCASPLICIDGYCR